VGQGGQEASWWDGGRGDVQWWIGAGFKLKGLCRFKVKNARV
jgi:hypothetical protein